MKIVIQRVSSAAVEVNGSICGQIEQGLLILFLALSVTMLTKTLFG